MSDNFVLRFTGLCGIVPRDAIDVTPNQVRVLLVDARQPPPGHGHGHGIPHEPHVPVLVCSTKFIDPLHTHPTDPRKPDLIFVNPLGGEEAVFFLNDQDVSIANTAGAPLKFVHDPGSGSGCHSTGNWRNIEWVASMAKISPLPSPPPPPPPPPPQQFGSEVVADDCFVTHPRAEVAARVALTQGEIRNGDLARDGSDQVIKWEFKTLGGSPFGGRQVLAEVVEVEVQIAASPGQVDIVTSLLRQTTLPAISRIFPQGFNQQKIIRLTPRGGQVIATIKNVPYLDLLGLRERLAPGQRDTDEHFAHFYALSATPQATRLPHPILVVNDPTPCTENLGPSLRTPQCPPDLFAPHPSA